MGSSGCNWIVNIHRAFCPNNISDPKTLYGKCSLDMNEKGLCREVWCPRKVRVIKEKIKEELNTKEDWKRLISHIEYVIRNALQHQTPEERPIIRIMYDFRGIELSSSTHT